MRKQTLTKDEATKTKERIANYPQGVNSKAWGYGPLSNTTCFAFYKDNDILRDFG
jgi:hypothetical protein